MDRYTLLYIKLTSSKVLLCSPRNYTQNCVITYTEKESDIYIYIYICVCVCVCESLLCTLETDPVLQINYTSINRKFKKSGDEQGINWN